MEQTDGNSDFIKSNIDAIQLTVLLKSIGFRLEFFDFTSNDNNNVDNAEKKGLEIEIKCNTSGIKSKLSFNSIICCCPKSNVNINNSFWEVQGMAPNTPNKVNGITDSSSNLLPILKPNALKATTIEFQTVLDKLNYFIENDVVKPAQPPILTVSEAIKLGIKIAENSRPLFELDNKSPMNGNKLLIGDHQVVHYSTTPLSSINVTPVTSDQFVDSDVGVPKIILPKLDPETKPDTNGVSNIGNHLNPGDNDEFKSPSSDIFEDASPNLTQIKEPMNLISVIRDAQNKLEDALNLLQRKNLSNCSTPLQSNGYKNACSALPLPSTTTRRHSLSVLPIDPKTQTKVIPNKRIVKPVMPLKNGTIILNKPIQPISKKLKPISTQLGATRSDTPRPNIIATTATASSSASSDIAVNVPRVKKPIAKVTSTGASLRPTTNLTKVPSKSMPKLAITIEKNKK